MIASLPMYDRPETRAANDRLWAQIRTHLGAGPENLSRDVEGLDHWRDPDLVFSQTCGMPYRLHLQNDVQLVGTPVLDLPEQPDLATGHYRSVMIARKEAGLQNFADAAGKSLACNMAISQSGWAAPQNEALAHGFSFDDVVLTGAHLASAKAVAKGHAEVAAIDILTWELITRHEPELVELLTGFHLTPPTPALPYITSLGQDVAALSDAVTRAIVALSQADRDTMCIRGLTQIAAQDYLAVPSPAFPGGREMSCQ